MSWNRRKLVVIALALTTGGCSTSWSLSLDGGKKAPPAPATRPVVQQPVVAQGEADFTSVNRAKPTPVVNIFGEFNNSPVRADGGSNESGLQQHTMTEEGYDADVVIDPTSKWMAFTSTRHHERSDIYLQRVDGNSVIQLTSDPADDAQPSFSPDGRRIAFTSNRAGTWDIYVMDIDGKSVQQVAGTAAQEMHPSFSPDGTRLVYCALSARSDQWELWVVDLSSQEKRMVGHGLFPTWSPAKGVDRIAFQRSRQRGSRWFSLWTLDLVDGEPRRLTEIAASSNAAVVSPSWNKDGSRLAFSTIVSDGNKPGQKGVQDVWVINADGTNRQRLTDGTGVNVSPFWSASGRIFFISDRSGTENIWSLRVEEGQQPQTAGAKNEKVPAVGSTDGGEVGR
jgi:TolB protein